MLLCWACETPAPESDNSAAEARIVNFSLMVMASPFRKRQLDFGCPAVFFLAAPAVFCASMITRPEPFGPAARPDILRKVFEGGRTMLFRIRGGPLVSAAAIAAALLMSVAG